MSDDDWRIEDIRRDLTPVFKALGKAGAGPRHAVLLGHEVVETDDVMAWCKVLESPERIVEQTTVNRYWISTVFLGLNHNYYGSGPPLWFETMVFEDVGGEKQKGDRFCRRYTTWQEAEAGHAETVEIIRYGNF